MTFATAHQDPYSALIGLLDAALMSAYAFVRRNARRIAHLVLTLAPLLALLASSCKTNQTDYLSRLAADAPARFRATLFPGGDAAAPAAGYVEAARRYVENSEPAMNMLTKAEVGYIFGQPSFRRHDGDADIWQYSAGACVVNLYFYGKDALAHIDVNLKAEDDAFRTAPASAKERLGCLRAIG